jgi:DNA polymerase III epsilon subunit-like protein
MAMTDPGTLADRARVALEASNDGLTPTELAGALFGAAATRLAPLVTQAEALLARLRARGEALPVANGRWVAEERVASAVTSPISALNSTIATSGAGFDAVTRDERVSAIAVTFAGLRGGRPRLLEAALVRLDGGVEVMAWSSLANPDPESTGRVRLPTTVLERVGLEPEAFEDAPSAPLVVAELAELIAGTTVVGHDVATVLDALGALSRWHGVASPYRRGMTLVDTEAMARALLPDLTRPSLDRVAAAVGAAPVRRDRAPERARQVAAIWRVLVARAALARDPLRPSGSRTASGMGPHRSPTLGDQVARGAMSRTAPGAELPEVPGIYRFHDSDGAVMYVGKATNLRARIAQHFGGVGTSARGDALLSRVVTISHVVTACELDAALLEQSTISATRPPYNVQATAKQRPTYLYLDDGEAVPRIGGTHDPATRPVAATFGPYRTASDARKLARIVVRAFGIRPCTRKLPARSARMRVPCLLYGEGTCPAPCAPHVSKEEYGVRVALARAFLADGRDAALLAIDERLRDLPEVDDGAQAVGVDVGSRRWLNGVRRALVRFRIDVRPLLDVPRGAWLTLACKVHARRAAEDASVVTFLVSDGRLAARREWRECDGQWVGDPSTLVETDAARDAIVCRRVQRDLGTRRVFVSRWGPPVESTLALWVMELAADPLAWEDVAIDDV